MNLSPYPIHTKQTRTNNNLSNQNNYDFFRPILSNQSMPIYQDNEFHMIDLERSSISTRNETNSIKKPPQQSFQHDYYSSNFETLNLQNNQNDQDVNKFLTRNPVNSRRDELEKTRNNEKQDFLRCQGGNLNNFADFKVESTRKSKNVINSSNYVPMPLTMEIPKENI